MSVHFSKLSDEWETPKNLYDQLDAEFQFELDPFCTAENKKCPVFITTDGFAEPWGGLRAFVNPPYSRLAEAIGKCAHEAQEAESRGLVVMLIPARTDTKAFHKHIWDASTHKPRTGVELRLLPGRLKFELKGKPQGTAPFPSALVIFRPRP